MQSEVRKMATLRRTMLELLDTEDLKTICFDLGVDFDSLSGDNKNAKTRELLLHCQREQRMPELLATLLDVRPQVGWFEISDSTKPTRHGNRKCRYSNLACMVQDLQILTHFWVAVSAVPAPL